MPAEAKIATLTIIQTCVSCQDHATQAMRLNLMTDERVGGNLRVSQGSHGGSWVLWPRLSRMLSNAMYLLLLYLLLLEMSAGDLRLFEPLVLHGHLILCQAACLTVVWFLRPIL